MYRLAAEKELTDEKLGQLLQQHTCLLYTSWACGIQGRNKGKPLSRVS